MKTTHATLNIASVRAARPQSHRSRMIAPLLAALCALALPTSRAYAQNATVTIQVDATTLKGVVPTTAFGVNTAAWDANLSLQSTLDRLNQAGVNMLRFPGGATADRFHWADDSTTPPDPGVVVNSHTFDAFLRLVSGSKSSPIITVNYGSNITNDGGGDPTEAAAWVKYANIGKTNSVKYWEIGNEVYGNGYYYDVKFETDLHKSLDPKTYALNVLQYIRQMKQVDPAIKIGVVLTTPYAWPDGVHDSKHLEWNPTVLDNCGSMIDFVTIHWYAQQKEDHNEDDTTLLASPSKINTVGGSAGIAQQVRDLINTHCGSNAPNVQIFVTETNSINHDPGKQTLSVVNALFLADDITTWLENGAANVDWWALHNAPVWDQTPYDGDPNPSYGTYGLLSSDTTVSGQTAQGENASISESGINVPYRSYYGLQMAHNLMQSGDSIISASSDQTALVAAHATRQPNGHLKLMLINKNRNATVSAAVALNGFTPSGSAQTFYYGKDSSGITNGTATVSRSFTTALPPYSLTVLDMTPAPVSSSPAFTTVASAAPATLAPGQTATIHVTSTDTGGALTNGVLDLEVFDASGSRVGQQFYTGQNFAANETKDYNWSYAAPSDMGAYTVKVGVFSQNWASLLYWNDNAAAFSVFLTDPAQYTFENGTQGWTTTGGAIAGVSSSTTRAFRGSHALAVNFSGAYSDTQQVYVPLPTIAAGKTVTIHVWIPGGSAVYAIQPYTLQGASGNWQWTGNFQYTSGMTPNAWNTITLDVPANAAIPLAQLGVQFFTGSAWSGTCYIDSISW